MGGVAVYGGGSGAGVCGLHALGRDQSLRCGNRTWAELSAVQVKSTSYRRGDGYYCELTPNHEKKQDYTLEQIDLFAAYVIPVNAWYLIPASRVLGERRIGCVMLSPVVPPTKKKSYCYEGYREAWSLLRRSRRELAEYGR